MDADIVSPDGDFLGEIHFEDIYKTLLILAEGKHYNFMLVSVEDCKSTDQHNDWPQT